MKIKHEIIVGFFEDNLIPSFKTIYISSQQYHPRDHLCNHNRYFGKDKNRFYIEDQDQLKLVEWINSSWRTVFYS